MSVQKNHTALAVLFGAVCAVLLPASCQRDVPAGGMSREQELDITVSAVLPSVPVSVTSAENAGDGTSASLSSDSLRPFCLCGSVIRTAGTR